MKTWWKNYKISRALDERCGPAGRSASEPGETPKGRGMAQSLVCLDAHLRQSVPLPSTPPDLHDSVMRAVRHAARPAPANLRRPTYGIRLALPALALIAVAGLAWWFGPRPPSRELGQEQLPRTLMLATASRSTLQAGKRVAQEGPAAMLAPLEREMALLQSDVRKAAQFAIATLP